MLAFVLSTLLLRSFDRLIARPFMRFVLNRVVVEIFRWAHRSVLRGCAFRVVFEIFR